MVLILQREAFILGFRIYYDHFHVEIYLGFIVIIFCINTAEDIT